MADSLNGRLTINAHAVAFSAPFTMLFTLIVGMTLALAEGVAETSPVAVLVALVTVETDD